MRSSRPCAPRSVPAARACATMSAPMARSGSSAAACWCTTARASPAGAAARRSARWCRAAARPSSALPASADLLLQALLDQRVHELRHVAAERGDLAHQCRGNEHVLLGGREKDVLEVGIKAAVHAGELELVLEVRYRAQPAQHHARALLA